MVTKGVTILVTLINGMILGNMGGFSIDNINSPAHYTNGDIEVIDYIRDKLSPVEFQGYCNGNIIKYISRYRLKGGIEDLKKAEAYLKWQIKSMEENNG